jgi:hypothetical protein
VERSLMAPSVLFVMGSKGMKSSCSTESREPRSAWDRVSRSRASLGGSTQERWKRE